MPKLDLTRRQFLGGLAAAPLIAVSATAAYASLIEPHSYEVGSSAWRVAADREPGGAEAVREVG